MTGRHATVLALVCAMSACHSTPHKEKPAATADTSTAENNTAPSEAPAPGADNNAAPPSAETPATEPAAIPPCLPVENTPKLAPRPKPKPVVRTPPTPQPPVAAPPPVPAEASVKLMPTSSASILGKKVRTQQGDDLGRVVDVLADAQGRVRMAIIEFGGFLGVGNRRIAVEWPLLKFHPEDPDAPIVVDASRAKLQATPEYKGGERPLALMAPEAAAPPPPAAPQPTAPK